VTNDRRMKLSDVEAQTNYAFCGTPTTFANAYPTVATLKVDVETKTVLRGEREESYSFNQESLRPILDCRNPRCFGGGIDLDRLLRFTVVGPKLTTFETTQFCTGYEGSPKGRRRTDSCDTMFKVKVAVTYKDDTAEI
jgi:hypothetical protein